MAPVYLKMYVLLLAAFMLLGREKAIDGVYHKVKRALWSRTFCKFLFAFSIFMWNFECVGTRMCCFFFRSLRREIFNFNAT